MEKRLIPVNMYDITAMEQWFTQMGEEGLVLKSFSGRKAVFQDDYCQKIKYKIIPTVYDEDAPPREMKELFEEEGWHYVGTYQKLLFVFSNESEYPKPIPFSREEERAIYEELRRKKQRSVIFSMLAVLTLMGMQLFFLYLKWDDYALGKTYDSGVVYLFLFLINLIGARREYHSNILLKRKLESFNLPEEMDSPFMPTTKWFRVEFLLTGLMFAFMFAPVITMIRNSESDVLIDQSDIPFSYVSLEELETAEPNREYYNDFTYVDTKTSILVPVQYELEQDGNAIYESDGVRERDAVHLSLSYYETRYRFLGNQLLQRLMERDDVIKIEQEGLDQTWIEENNKDKKIFMLKDNRILVIKYRGQADISSHLKGFSKTLQSPSILFY
ncbi:DUF2812 domain-containing protein [Anaerotignum sp.]|uniref:DUF2812 domain-containing protein n=1 Tax=Anaerotignum sp. TaxID=2039241 RepID=UPI00289E04C3|nr:DUF2812 domain-containing protein [Anaerotignum sp.]